jgi:hypothetical protein
LPCRGWDLTEEEVDFSHRSLLVVVSFVVVAAVAVVAVAVIAVLWGGIAWFACGDGVLLSAGVGGRGVGGRERGWGLRDIGPPTGLRMLKGPLAVLQLLCEL